MGICEKFIIDTPWSFKIIEFFNSNKNIDFRLIAPC